MRGDIAALSEALIASGGWLGIQDVRLETAPPEQDLWAQQAEDERGVLESRCPQAYAKDWDSARPDDYDFPEQTRDSSLYLMLPSTHSHGVVSAFSLRLGGVSKAPYESLNLSYAVGDDEHAVNINRARLQQALAQACHTSLPRHEMVNPHQVHGIEVMSISTLKDLQAYTEGLAQGCRPQADAVVCTMPSVPVLLTFADCVPIILTVPGGFAVVHSGWRSTLGKIALHASRALLQACPGASSKDIHAWVGPHIGEKTYEVSQDLIDEFTTVFGPQARVNNRHLNLDSCVVSALMEIGVPASQIHLAKICTYSHPSLFFTHRGLGPQTGRIAALAWLIDDGSNGYTS